MRDYADPQSPEDQDADPYGDVALGVECAWPESIPAVEVAETGAA